MDAIRSLTSIDATRLLGRDPRSLVQDVLDDSAQEHLAVEMHALDALVASQIADLPVGRAGVLAAEMSPLLCSLFRDVAEIRSVLAYVHSWIRTLGDVGTTARMVDLACREAKLVRAEYGSVDGDALDAIPAEDRDALLRWRELDRRYTAEVSMGDWAIRLRIHDHQTLTALVAVDDLRVVVGVAHVDQDQGPRAANRIPELTA